MNFKMPSTQFIAAIAMIAGVALQGCSDSRDNPDKNYPNAQANINQVNLNVRFCFVPFSNFQHFLNFTK